MTRARNLSKLSNPAVFTVDANNNIGVNSISPDAKLDVIGIVSATSFFGDGSGLTGVANTAIINADQINVTGVVTARSGLRVVGGGLTVTGVSTFFGNTNFNATGLFPYSKTLNFGSNTSQEGQLFATSEYFYINSSADNGVFVQSNGFIELKKATGSDKYIEMNSHPNHNGEVSLYYDGNKKLETTGSGINVTGVVTATSFTGDGSQLSGVGGENDITSSLFI
mgnify:CR=1 FL=1